MSKKQFLLLVYYSQLPLVLLSVVLTGSISAVLYTQINWRPILLVGLSTFFTYSLDNLIDWQTDRFHYKNIADAVKRYHKFTYGLIPLSGLGIILLISSSSNEFLIAILLLGAAVAMATTRFANYRENSSNPNQPIYIFILNRIFISIIWTIVCVFLPLWYDSQSINKLTWHTFIYMLNLIFIYAVLWKFEKSPSELVKKLRTSKLMPFLVINGISSMTVVFIDIIIGLTPLYNLINLLPPVACLIAVYFIVIKPEKIWQKISVLTIGLITIMIFTTVIFLVAP